MKKLTLPFLIGGALLTQSAFASDAQYAISYLTSWGGIGAGSVETLKDVKANTLLLSFGGWDANGNISSSDNIVSMPTYDPWYIQASAYSGWSGLKLARPDIKMMVAFGGETYESMWAYLKSPQTRENLAQNLVKMLHTNYPVYQKNLKADEMVGKCLHTNWSGACDMGVNQLAGTVQLDGIDFDFEKVARLTPEENDNVLAVAKRVRELLKASGSKKLISLTTYHVGADPAECQSAQVTENCSFTESSRSSHHGEVLPLLTKGKDVFDFFNVMAYDAGPDFKYDVAMANYARAVGDKRKIILGQTINSQWGPAGRFVESRQNNVDRAGWQAEHGYGGFFIWTLGANNQQQPLAQQVDYFNEMKERADLMSGQSANEDVTAPTAPTGLKVMESNNAITLVWQPAADSVGVKGYSILRNGVPVGSSTDTRWTDNNIEPGGVIYRYTVKAFDAAGNLSDASNAVDVKTGPAPEAVTVAPDAPAGLSLISAGKAELSIQWRSVAGAVKYKVLRNGMQVATVAGTRFDDSGLKAATAYSYTVVAENAKGQTSLASAALKVKTQASAVKPAPAPQPSSSEAWKTGVNYKTGDIVIYKGKQYRCLQGHPSMAHWTPAETMALWQVVR
ncbi:carbohydrate-binding protein [Pantoea sp.]|uniref:carbohydrate-binding protein n=1 Tax=Pantoea sp. TaxID=69393 RepID=UPI0028AB5756|nr:glycosyl hydrolase family 18 protein [Pantoea sp.]